MKILVKGANWLGDAVMTLPTLGSLRRMQPRARISVLTKRAFAELYRGSDAVHDVIPYDRKSGAGRIPSGMRLAHTIRKQRFDVALLLPRSFSSAMVTFSARVPRRIGYGGEGRSALLTDVVDRDRELLKLHRVHYYHHLLSVLGTPPRPRAPRLSVPKDTKDWAAERLPDGGPLVAINAGATYGLAKQWYPERFARVARRLIRSYGARIVYVGGPSEVDVAERVLGLTGDRELKRALSPW